MGFDETLEKLSQTGDAAFVIDGSHRIIFWNGACEKLIGRTAHEVIGKRCDEVLAGRDGNGNVYCHGGCPASHQVREGSTEPIHDFDFNVRTGGGERRWFSTSLFAIPSFHPSRTTVVHVLRPSAAPRSVPLSTPEPLAPMTEEEAAMETLTPREREVLDCLVRGFSTAVIAEKLSILRVTVRNHVQKILQKLGAHSKLEAVAIARRGSRPQPLG